ncbi:uncharacterized protein BJ212DRAFT_1389379 [Suillus subaureus]|uniref:Uncharacterized protein n=1 Tax=Suillus subaureus TaxID=48587 RepID=A0A9P7DXV4_9AGAM|nr:uncharacterized protein BJ212DRAFT_1389379 [Suillus subaureus]KAG1806076.1 hypothetical protein BJ212DRAFT_1389379 [Suillus subaureus]
MCSLIGNLNQHFRNPLDPKANTHCRSYQHTPLNLAWSESGSDCSTGIEGYLLDASSRSCPVSQD